MGKLAVTLTAGAVATIVVGLVYAQSVRDQAKAEVVKACIEKGGSYHETWLKHRPKCRQ